MRTGLRNKNKQVVGHYSCSGNARATCLCFKQLNCVFCGDTSVHPKCISRNLRFLKLCPVHQWNQQPGLMWTAEHQSRTHLVFHTGGFGKYRIGFRGRPNSAMENACQHGHTTSVTASGSSSDKWKTHNTLGERGRVQGIVKAVSLLQTKQICWTDIHRRCKAR